MKKKVATTIYSLIILFFLSILIVKYYPSDSKNTKIIEYFKKNNLTRSIYFFKVKDFENINNITLDKYDFLSNNLLVFKIIKNNLLHNNGSDFYQNNLEKSVINYKDFKILGNLEYDQKKHQLIVGINSDAITTTDVKKSITTTDVKKWSLLEFTKNSITLDSEDRFNNLEFLKVRFFNSIFKRKQAFKIYHKLDFKNNFEEYYVTRFFFDYKIPKNFTYIIKVPKNVYRITLRDLSIFGKSSREFDTREKDLIFLSEEFNINEIIFYKKKAEYVEHINYSIDRKDKFINYSGTTCKYPNYLLTNYPFKRVGNLFKNCTDFSLLDTKYNSTTLFIKSKIIYEDSSVIFFAVKLNNLAAIAFDPESDNFYKNLKFNFEFPKKNDHKFNKKNIEVSIYRSQNINHFSKNSIIYTPQSLLSQIDYLKPLKSIYFFPEKLIKKTYECYDFDSSQLEYFNFLTFTQDGYTEQTIKLRLVSKFKNIDALFKSNYLYKFRKSDQIEKLCLNQSQIAKVAYGKLKFINFTFFKKDQTNKIVDKIYTQSFPLILSDNNPVGITNIYSFEAPHYEFSLNKNSEISFDLSLIKLNKNSRYLLIRTTTDLPLNFVPDCYMEISLFFKKELEKKCLNKKDNTNFIIFDTQNNYKENLLNSSEIKFKNNFNKKIKLQISGIFLFESFYLK